MANLPPWGATVPLVGNNPLMIAVPRSSGHVVLDMAMSQFSYGTLATYRSRGEALPVIGGYGPDGEPTRDAAAIEATGRLLPIGFWKGSGLALLLDIVAALLSGGNATHEIPQDPERETGLSQLFMAIDAAGVSGTGTREMDRVVEGIVAALHEGAAAAGAQVRHPGERTLEARRRSMEVGVPVDATVWREVLAL
jgi:3-dehydro-L-gulonate 2-dehydrogenase